MAIVDDRGRVGGRINLIDLAIVAIALVLIPAAYGAYLLFRSPVPKLLAITPTRLYQGNQLRVEVQGQDLRPFLRVSFNDIQGRTFLISGTRSAQVDLPDLAPGVYDIVLYDFSQEVSRLPKAFTIMPFVPAPVVQMELAGAFMNVSEATAKELKPGVRFPSTGDALAEILTVDSAMPSRIRLRAGQTTVTVPVAGASELPATLRVSCFVRSNTDASLGCVMNTAQQAFPIVPDTIISLPMGDRLVTYQISQVRVSGGAMVSDVRVRLIVTPELLSRIKAGDADSNPKAVGQPATIVSVGSSRSIGPGEAGPDAPLGGPLLAADAMLRVPLQPLRSEWTYKDVAVKTGAPITFETSGYIVHGQVLSMTPPVAR